MIVTTDHPSADYNFITAIGKEEEVFYLFDYVDITYKDSRWIGQISKPNINILTLSGVSPFDPSVTYALELFQKDPNIQMIESVEKWEIRLLGELKGGGHRTIRRRPKPGAVVSRLDRDTTIRFLHLPKYKEESDGKNNVIGYLLNADDVPLCVSPTIFNHHIMVSGGTGSGKSNTGANLVTQASRHGYCVILYDAKPDYQKINAPNTDSSVDSIFLEFEKYNIGKEGTRNIKRVCFYSGPKKKYDDYDFVLGYNTSDLDAYMLASLFLGKEGNQKQHDEFIHSFFEVRKKNPKGFNIDKITENIKERTTADGIHEATAGAITRAIERNKGRMLWLDSVGEKACVKSSDDPFSSCTNKLVKKFDPKDIVESGCVVHVDCDGLSEENYALFLGMFLGACQRYRTDTKGDGVPIVQFIDEAHRVFDNSSKHQDILSQRFNRAMREGRTLRHGIILSLQNSTQVPSLVMNNINSHIVMKQNSLEVAKSSTQTMGSEFAYQSMNLGPGHALVKMFESSAVAIVQMAPSPFELQRADNT